MLSLGESQSLELPYNIDIMIEVKETYIIIIRIKLIFENQWSERG